MISTQKVRSGARTFCEAVGQDGLLDNTGDIPNASGGAVVAFLHKKPEAYRPLCLAVARGAPASFELNGLKNGNLVDWHGYETTYCRFAPLYVGADMQPDVALLSSQHPEVLEPFFVAGMLGQYDKDPGAYHNMSRVRFVSQARAFVTEGIRTGVFVYRDGTLRTVHGPKERALIRKYFG